MSWVGMESWGQEASTALNALQMAVRMSLPQNLASWCIFLICASDSLMCVTSICVFALFVTRGMANTDNGHWKLHSLHAFSCMSVYSISGFPATINQCQYAQGHSYVCRSYCLKVGKDCLLGAEMTAVQPAASPHSLPVHYALLDLVGKLHSVGVGGFKKSFEKPQRCRSCDWSPSQDGEMTSQSAHHLLWLHVFITVPTSLTPLPHCFTPSWIWLFLDLCLIGFQECVVVWQCPFL